MDTSLKSINLPKLTSLLNIDLRQAYLQGIYEDEHYLVQNLINYTITLVVF